MPEPRYRADDLIRYATQLFAAAGCDGDKPEVIARGLVEADLLGHTTHGLQLAAAYLRELESGAMTGRGEPEVIADRPSAVTWEGRQLPGVWLTAKAVELCIERALKTGIVGIAIRRSHHIACLATFLQRATDRGLMIIIASSDPSVCSVAPYGGRKAVFTPDPMAIGIPTTGDPILIDISSTITTNGLTNRLRAEGKRYPGKWALDAEGNATDDTNTLFTDPPGTLLPTGGVDHGHKGYSMALMVEALTNGLCGFGRFHKPTHWGASVFVQVIDPAAFGGSAEYLQEMGWIASACRDNPPVPGVQAVRLPGQFGLERKRKALADGVTLYPGILNSLQGHAQKWGVKAPEAV